MNSCFGSYRSPKTIALVGKYHSREIAESLRQLAPDIAPDFAKFTRVETYDADMNIYR